MKISAEVVKLDGKENRNGRIYTEENLQTIINSYNECNLIQYDCPIGWEVNLEKVCGKVKKAELKDKSIFIEAELDDSNYTKEILEAINNGKNMYVVPQGFAVIESDNIVKKYELLCFCVVDDPSFIDLEPIKFI